jgi:hypothetical protein
MWLTSNYSETQATDAQDSVFDIHTNEHNESNPAMFSSFGGHPAIKILESGHYLVSMRGNMKFTL